MKSFFDGYGGIQMRVSVLCRSVFFAPAIVSGAFVQTAGAASGGITVLPDASVFIQIVNFVFLIWALNVFLYKPIRNILLKRKQKSDGLQKSIDDCHVDAKEKENAWASGIKDARAKGLGLKDALIQGASEQEKAIIAKINETASQDLNEIRKKIARDVDDVRAVLHKEIGTFADAIGQKILGRVV
jgi:F-type H+-transporting ATPase subunit b